jgi:hypothetical protein
MFELWGENYYFDLDKIQNESQFVNESGETQSNGLPKRGFTLQKG